jgi:hypothetical protein
VRAQPLVVCSQSTQSLSYFLVTYHHSVDPATPRDGTRRNPFQQDATRFKGDAAATCGETLGGGDNDIEAGTAAVMQQNGATLPQVSAGGQVMMTLHQVNGDGAGPYTCMIDATGTGTNWQPMQVTQNIDGNARGRNNDQQMQDLPLTAAVPADMACTGTVAGQSNVCMVRCENPARAGPFGGCVPVQMAGAAGAATGAGKSFSTASLSLCCWLTYPPSPRRRCCWSCHWRYSRRRSWRFSCCCWCCSPSWSRR